MIFKKTILIGLISLFSVYSYASGSSVEVNTDSIYQSLEKFEKANRLVWINPAGSYFDENSVKEIGIGGFYFTEPSLKDNFKGEFTKALQLDFKLNPTNKQRLPGLATLSAIANENLLREYCDLLKTIGIKNGFHYLILPELNEQQLYFQKTLKAIKDTDPDYFLFKSELSFDPEPKRKEFYSEMILKRAIIVSADNLLEYKNVLKKGPKDVEHLHFAILDQLTKIYNNFYVVKGRDSSQLLHEIWTKSVVPFQSKIGILPVKGDTIGIWLSDEDTNLKLGLELYYEKVLNIKYDKIPYGIPIIIDGRTNFFQAQEYAFAYQQFNPIIWIGSEQSLINSKVSAILYTPEVNEIHNEILPEMIIGAEAVEGKKYKPLPSHLVAYNSESIKDQKILSYGKAIWRGMNQDYLDSIDYIATEMIENFASPGAQVLVAKDGKIVFNRSYGYLTYDSLIKVEDHTLYDIASLTKVNATLLAVMSLMEHGLLHLDSAISKYLPKYVGTNKDSISIRQLLVHQAGIQSYIPFWKRSLKGDMLEAFYYRTNLDEEEDQRSYGYHPDPVMRDSLESWIRASSLIKNNEYHYSDIGFMILHQVIESITGISMESYLHDNFYKPLGLDRTIFNPLRKGFEIYEIAPTEYDDYLRDELVWGNVHDRNAVVFGGIAGHAGLFSTSKDLAIVLQMLLQEGYYGGKQFIDNETISEFSHQQFEGNRRALGWDKPGLNNLQISSYASTESFGHTGFTGTMVWADPKHKLIYIFLSNRIFPDSNNIKLITMDVRKRIHDLIYKSIIDL